jgi:hypothetical protein
MKKKSKGKSLTPAQSAKLLGVTEGDMKELILVAMTTGQRIGDVVRLKAVDVDYAKNAIRFNYRRCRRDSGA